MNFSWIVVDLIYEKIIPLKEHDHQVTGFKDVRWDKYKRIHQKDTQNYSSGKYDWLAMNVDENDAISFMEYHIHPDKYSIFFEKKEIEKKKKSGDELLDKLNINQRQNVINKYKSDKIKLFDNPHDAVVKADCVMSDIWVSMGKDDSNKKISLFEDFQINDILMTKAKNEALFMHCLPAHRNEEVTDSVIDGNKSIIWQQAKNRMFVQQSILNFCIA